MLEPWHVFQEKIWVIKEQLPLHWDKKSAPNTRLHLAKLPSRRKKIPKKFYAPRKQLQTKCSC